MAAVLDDRPDENLFELMLDAIPQPVFLLDEERILYVNAPACEMLAASDRSLIIGMPVDELVHRDAREAAAERRRFTIRRRHGMRDISLKLVALDGTPRRLTVDTRAVEHGDRVVILGIVKHVAID